MRRCTTTLCGSTCGKSSTQSLVGEAVQDHKLGKNVRSKMLTITKPLQISPSGLCFTYIAQATICMPALFALYCNEVSHENGTCVAKSHLHITVHCVAPKNIFQHMLSRTAVMADSLRPTAQAHQAKHRTTICKRETCGTPHNKTPLIRAKGSTHFQASQIRRCIRSSINCSTSNAFTVSKAGPAHISLDDIAKALAYHTLFPAC